MKISSVLPIVCCFSSLISCQQWTWLHKRFFTPQELVSLASQKKILYQKSNLPHFNQLVFSWNAVRPSQGYFTFLVQVQIAQTQAWTAWYKMMDWGHGVQKSYVVDEHKPISYNYVRLEMGNNSACAFRIKIEPHEGADLTCLRSIHVCLSDISNFMPEERMYDIPSVHITHVPVLSQLSIDHPRNGGFCSPTSCTMVISYLMKKQFDAAEFAQGAYDFGLGVYGSWPFNLAHAYELCEGRWQFAVARLPSFAHLYQFLRKSIPIAVSVRGPLVGSASPYSAGHLLVVVGWDNITKEVICHDPAFATSDLVIARYPLKDFLRAWERSRRLSYLVEKVPA